MSHRTGREDDYMIRIWGGREGGRVSIAYLHLNEMKLCNLL